MSKIWIYKTLVFKRRITSVLFPCYVVLFPVMLVNVNGNIL